MIVHRSTQKRYTISMTGCDFRLWILQTSCYPSALSKENIFLLLNLAAFSFLIPVNRYVCKRCLSQLFFPHERSFLDELGYIVGSVTYISDIRHRWSRLPKTLIQNEFSVYCQTVRNYPQISLRGK